MRRTVRELAMRRSIIEGASYALMVGLGALYIVANGIRLGPGSLEIGLLLALPLFLGALDPLLALRLMRASRSRRRGLAEGQL